MRTLPACTSNPPVKPNCTTGNLNGKMGVRPYQGALPMIRKRLRLTLEMIKFEHSVFALPFALTGALLALRDDGFRSVGVAWKVGWIVVAMVAARSAAMAFNRLVDQGIDARNPRTSMRHLPAGLI